MSAIAELRDVAVAFRGKTVLENVTGAFGSGSLTAIVGSNGAGKSTLLKSLVGVVPLAAGRVSLHIDRKRMAYLAQQSNIERSFPLSVLDCVTLGFWPASSLWRRIGSRHIASAMAALETVGLADLAHHPVGNLSAGQFQRMLFVRVQLQNAEFILLDEPFNAVDARTTSELLEIVMRWHSEGRTVAAVLHDHDQVRRYFPQTLLLARTPIAWGPTQDVLCAENLWRAGQLSAPCQAQAA